MAELTGAGKITGMIRKISQTALQLKQALVQPPYRGAPPSWTRSMTIIVILLPLVLLGLHLFDAVIVQSVSTSDFPGLGILRALTNVSRTLLWLPIAGLVWVLTAIAVKPSSGLRSQRIMIACHGWATLVLGASVIASVFVEIGKLAIGRARPFLLDSVGPTAFSPFRGEYLYESFPSGHSMTAGVMMVALWIWLPRWRYLTLPCCLLLAFSRIAVGAHYPTDVVAGLTIGFVSCWWFSRFLATRNIILILSPGKTFPSR